MGEILLKVAVDGSHDNAYLTTTATTNHDHYKVKNETEYFHPTYTFLRSEVTPTKAKSCNSTVTFVRLYCSVL